MVNSQVNIYSSVFTMLTKGSFIWTFLFWLDTRSPCYWQRDAWML